MSAEQVRKLLGGYATGTLTPEERRALCEAALEDQQLFDAMAREQSLRDLLRDPAARAQLLATLSDAPATWRQRAARWMWGHAVGLAAVACFVTVAGYFARQAHFTPPRVVMVATEPTTVEVNGSQQTAQPSPPRRVFDLGSVTKAAAPPPQMPAPPLLPRHQVEVGRNLAAGEIAELTVPPPPVPLPAPALPPQAMGQLAGIGGMGGPRGAGGRGAAAGGGFGGATGGLVRPQAAPQPPPQAARTNVTIDGITDLDTGAAGNVTHFAPAMDSIAEVRVLNAPAGAATGAGTLTGTIVDSSGAAVPRAQVEAKNLATGTVRFTVSAPGGAFVFNGLAPASYSLTARATGFKTLESNNLAVTAGANLNLGRMAMALGAVTEEISVTAAATPVQTASSENSKLVDASQIADLTLKGRDQFAVLAAVPGVAFAAPLGGWKLDPLLVALVQRVRSGAQPAAEERRFVSGGKASVRITLANASADSLAQLRKAGFAIAGRNGNVLTGRIAVTKLEALAQLPFVVRIAPQ